MALGNAWHFPGNPEPFGNAGMRVPVFPTDSVSEVTVFSGDQYQGSGNPGNQLQDGSAVSFKQATDTTWTTVPMVFATAIDNNKYYSAQIPVSAFAAGTVVQYYLVIAYDDHDTTFLGADATTMLSVATGEEAVAQAAPFTFTIETPDKRGQWGDPFRLPNVGIHAHVLPAGLVLMWGRRDNPQQSLDTDPPSALAPGLPPAPPRHVHSVPLESRERKHHADAAAHAQRRHDQRQPVLFRSRVPAGRAPAGGRGPPR